MEHSSIILSILICHLVNRKDKLNRLMSSVYAQATGKEIEILIESDNGEMVVGAKRNSLLLKSKGKYVVFVDDDDEVANDYIDSILNALDGSPDCVGIEGIMRGTGYQQCLFRHSIQFQGHYTGTDAFYRTPNHLNPIKAVLAKRVMFQEIEYGEDKRFSYNIRPMLKTENYIDHPIYFYNKNVNEIIAEGEKYSGKNL